MTALEALMIAGLYVVPQTYDWTDPGKCLIPTEQGNVISCSSFGGFVPNVHDPHARAVTTTRELGVMPGMIQGAAPILRPELLRERTFADELATIPGAFDGAMREDQPGLADMAVPKTEGVAPRP